MRLRLEIFSKIDEELIVWSRTFRRAFGTAAEPSSPDSAEGNGGSDSADDKDIYADSNHSWEENEKTN
jgi:hypothetical protein